MKNLEQVRLRAEKTEREKESQARELARRIARLHERRNLQAMIAQHAIDPALPKAQHDYVLHRHSAAAMRQLEREIIGESVALERARAEMRESRRSTTAR